MTPLLHAGRHLGRGLFNALAELGAVRMAPPREPRAAAHRLAGALGATVLNFPEGTTTNGSRVARFWPGGFGIAQRLGVPIVPVAIRYGDPALAWCDQATFLPHYLQTIRRERIEVSLTFGLPLHARRGETATALANRARETIVHMLDTMRWIDAAPATAA